MGQIGRDTLLSTGRENNIEAWKKDLPATISPHNPRAVDVVREQAPLPGELRGCRDCRYSRGSYCSHPSFGERKLDVFTGRVNRVSLPAWKSLRSDRGACGPEGRLWRKCRPHRNFRTYAVLAATSAGTGLYFLFVLHTLWTLIFVPLTIFLLAMMAAISNE